MHFLPGCSCSWGHISTQSPSHRKHQANNPKVHKPLIAAVLDVHDSSVHVSQTSIGMSTKHLRFHIGDHPSPIRRQNDVWCLGDIQQTLGLSKSLEQKSPARVSQSGLRCVARRATRLSAPARQASGSHSIQAACEDWQSRVRPRLVQADQAERQEVQDRQGGARVLQEVKLGSKQWSGEEGPLHRYALPLTCIISAQRRGGALPRPSPELRACNLTPGSCNLFTEVWQC